METATVEIGNAVTEDGETATVGKIAMTVGVVTAGKSVTVLVGTAFVAGGEGETVGDVTAAAVPGAGAGLDGTVPQASSRSRINSR
ncbi:MAG: hypothetical protein ACUVRJ_08505 [Candidatus Villigracilaceae bacterium]